MATLFKNLSYHFQWREKKCFIKILKLCYYFNIVFFLSLFFSTSIRHLWHGGLMQRWAEQYAQLKSHECYFVPTTLRGGRKDVTLNDLLGAFIMLVSGLGISLFIIIFEIVWTRLKRQCLPQRKKAFTNTNCIYYISTIILKKILAHKI